MSLKKCDDKYELVAPDGGWGYAICLAGVIHLMTIGGFISSFGLIYNDFMKEIGLGSTEITLLNGVNAISLALGGIVTSPLLKIMSLRQLTLVAVLTYNFGTISMVFVRSVIPFYICVGALQGAGFGVIFNLTYAMVNDYFVEKRLFAYSIMKTTMAIFAMVAPQLVKISLTEYGFRGTILMISGVSLQSFIAVALMQPVAWHMKRVKKLPLGEETQVLLIDEKTIENGLNPKFTELKMESKSTEASKFDTENTGRRKSPWLVKTLNHLFDLPLMKLLLLSNVSWAIAMAGVADLTFLTFLPQALYSYGWNKDYVALALSSIGLGDLAGRGSFVILSKWLLKVGNQDMFIAGLVISVVARISILCSSNVNVALVFMTLYGIGRCFLALFLPLAICEVAGTEKFTAAMGLSLALMGCVNIGCGPIVGVIRDYTQSYDITFWIMAAVLLTFSISWTIELVYKRRQRSNKENKS